MPLYEQDIPENLATLDNQGYLVQQKNGAFVATISGTMPATDQNATIELGYVPTFGESLEIFVATSVAGLTGVNNVRRYDLLIQWTLGLSIGFGTWVTLHPTTEYWFSGHEFYYLDVKLDGVTASPTIRLRGVGNGGYDFTVVVKTSSTPFTVTNVISTDSSTLDYLTESSWVWEKSHGLRAYQPVVTERLLKARQVLTPTASTQNIDFSFGTDIVLDLIATTGNLSLTFTQPYSYSGVGMGATLTIKQHASTPRQISFPSGTVQNGGGGDIYSGGVAGQTDKIYLEWTGLPSPRYELNIVRNFA